MKNLMGTILLVLCATSLLAQTTNMNKTELGRTYSVNNQSRTVLPLLQKAEREFRFFDYEATFLTLENAVAQNPNSFEALLMRSKFKQLIGMEAEARIDFENASRINPLAANLYGYHGNQGLLRILSLEPEKAVTGLNTGQTLNYYYQTLDEQFLAKTEDDDNLGWQQLEEIVQEIEADNLLLAMDLIDTFLVDFPKSAIGYDLRGVVLQKQELLSEAVLAFSKAVTLDPNLAIAWYNFGKVEEELGRLEQAKIYFDKAIMLQEDLTKAYFGRALLAKRMGDKENALKDYNTIIEKNGEIYMEAYLNRGLTKKALGDYNGSINDINRALEAFPNNPKVLKNRGNLQLLFGLPQKAIDDYTRAIELDNNYAEAYYNRALAHFLLYDSISGCADLEKSADLGYEQASEASIHFCQD